MGIWLKSMKSFAPDGGDFPGIAQSSLERDVVHARIVSNQVIECKEFVPRRNQIDEFVSAVKFLEIFI